MALVLTMRRGFAVTVGEEVFTLVYVRDYAHFTVLRESDGEEFTINDMAWEEVAKDVFFMAGVPNYEGKVIRLMIEAPQSVLIVRGDKFYKESGE